MYRSKIEQTMDLTPKAIPISKLLSQILSDAVAFDKESHTKLIEICKQRFYLSIQHILRSVSKISLN